MVKWLYVILRRTSSFVFKQSTIDFRHNSKASRILCAPQYSKMKFWRHSLEWLKTKRLNNSLAAWPRGHIRGFTTTMVTWFGFSVRIRVASSRSWIRPCTTIIFVWVKQQICIEKSRKSSGKLENWFTFKGVWIWHYLPLFFVTGKYDTGTVNQLVLLHDVIQYIVTFGGGFKPLFKNTTYYFQKTPSLAGFTGFTSTVFDHL